MHAKRLRHRVGALPLWVLFAAAVGSGVAAIAWDFSVQAALGCSLVTGALLTALRRPGRASSSDLPLRRTGPDGTPPTAHESATAELISRLRLETREPQSIPGVDWVAFDALQKDTGAADKAGEPAESSTREGSPMDMITEARHVARHETERAGANAGATASAGGKPVAASGEYLTFRLGEEEYGIDILRVQEIRSYETPTRIANSPAFLKGVVDLRGVIVPIIDLRVKLGCATADFNASTVVIVLNLRGRVVGAVVDSVSEVHKLSADAIKPAPGTNSQVDTSFITGIATLDHRMLILMDIQGLMSSSDMGLFDQ